MKDQQDIIYELKGKRGSRSRLPTSPSTPAPLPAGGLPMVNTNSSSSVTSWCLPEPYWRTP